MAKDVLLRLGSYTFSIDTAAYDELARSAGFAWAEQPVVGRAPALQFVGEEAQTITLRGRIFPTRTRNAQEVEGMRALAARGRPLDLTTGTGRYLGRWVITAVGERHDVVFSDGTPRRIEFDLSIKKYDNGR